MYSLYRAWFGDGAPGENYPRLQETLSPPDTVVRVGNEGEHQFVAHKGVLAAHSGYLKALLASASTSTSPSVSSSFGSCGSIPATAIAVTATNVAGQTPRQPVTSVSVSSIGGEAFAPLLNYMYTGRLEVTLDNVYSVLLATHLLHMPGALEQCRAALLRLRAPGHLPSPMPVPAPAPVPVSTPTSSSMSSSAPPGAVNILRPIPNRLIVGPSMCWPPPTPLYPPAPAPAPATVGIPHLPQLQSSVLMQSTVPPSVSVIPGPTVHETQNSAHYSSAEIPSPKSSPNQHQRSRGSRVDSRPRSPEIVSSASLPFVAVAAAAFTAFAASNTTASSTTRASTPSQSASPTPSSTSPSPTPLRRGKKPATSEQQRGCSKEERDCDDSDLSSNPTQRRKSPVISIEDSSAGNRDSATETLSVTESDRGRSSRRRNRSATGSTDPSANNILSVVYDVACCDGPVRFHRVLNENYSSAAVCGSAQPPQQQQQPTRLQRPCMEIGSTSSENDENGGPGAARGGCGQAESTSVGGNGNGSYTCGYCRHTFKSQYCYRKHAKRHLLPTRVNESAGNRRQEAGRGRREVRLLDLNVQYYPCKICGCKFPSYYFVHKHRKLCHANAEERGRGGGGGGGETADGGNNQDQESATSTTQKSP